VGDLKAISVVGACTIGPLLLTYLLIAADMRSDLSELTPRQAAAEGVPLVGWKDLVARPEGRVRMLGYMMDGNQPLRDGTPVTMFILMPEAGQFLQPAQRTTGAMVAVRIANGQSVPFRFRSLVWAQGILRKQTAAYAIVEALAQPAGEREIGRWFTP
jgi:hypothetical protein